MTLEEALKTGRRFRLPDEWDETLALPALERIANALEEHIRLTRLSVINQEEMLKLMKGMHEK